MNTMTRILAILLVLGMACTVLIGCNSKTDEKPTSPAGTVAPGTVAPGTNATTQAGTTAPETQAAITQYGNYATDKPVRTIEEIFAQELKHTADTFATTVTDPATYTDEKLENIAKIADCIANYKQLVEEYGVQEQLNQLYEETGFTLDLGFGAEMINHYIKASGDTKDYSDRMEEMLSHPKVAAAQATTISAAMKAAENLVKDGQTVAQINQCSPMSYTGLKSQDGTIYFALGSYHTMADLSNVTRTGDTLSATVTFRIVDYYDWAVNNSTPEFTSYLAKLDDNQRTLVSELVDYPSLEAFCQADLAQLHYAGLAQNFLAHGTVVYNITWTAGQTFVPELITPAQ